MISQACLMTLALPPLYKADVTLKGPSLSVEDVDAQHGPHGRKIENSEARTHKYQSASVVLCRSAPPGSLCPWDQVVPYCHGIPSSQCTIKSMQQGCNTKRSRLRIHLVTYHSPVFFPNQRFTAICSRTWQNQSGSTKPMILGGPEIQTPWSNQHSESGGRLGPWHDHKTLQLW